MKVLCAFGKHNYGDPSRGIGYEFANFIPALQGLGHEVVHFDCWNKSLYADFVELNRKFLETITKEKPDVVLCVLMGYEIWLETIELARQGSDVRFIHWATDDSWKYEKFSRFIASVFDIYATTYPSAVTKAEAEGLDNIVLTQWAANSAVMRAPLPASQCEYAVSFIGSAYGNRKQWVADLRERGVDVSCFGYGWSAGAVAAEDIPRIIRSSQISLNFADSGMVVLDGKVMRNRQIKARVFEVPGAGGFLLTEPAEHLEDFYDLGNEVVCFESVDDLIEKIRCYLGNPQLRDRIAQAGFLRTQIEHTYEARFAQIFDELVLYAHNKEAPCIDMGAFSKLEKRHRIGWTAQAFRAFLVLPFMLVWGKKRGRRAARKALFELSWRVFGRKTYTASGWPGRLFYHES